MSWGVICPRGECPDPLESTSIVADGSENDCDIWTVSERSPALVETATHCDSVFSASGFILTYLLNCVLFV